LLILGNSNIKKTLGETGFRGLKDEKKNNLTGNVSPYVTSDFP